jgi:adenosylhomocysteine nucleosidase
MTGSHTIGIVVGLEAEARVARALGCPVAVGGGGAAGAGRAVAALIAQGVTQLVSFGLAGGLAPGLAAGTVIVPERVLGPAGAAWEVDLALAARLGHPLGTLLAVPDIVATAPAKAALWRQTAALAADIETGAVAAMAAAAGLGFAALRVVCDPAERNLPPAALTALDQNGRVRSLALLRSLAQHPGQVPALIALGRDAAAARRALIDQVRRIGLLSPR